MALRRTLLAIALTFAITSCDERSSGYVVASGPRDWSAHPAIVSLDAPTNAPIYAVSDVHGGYDRLVSLLARHHIIEAVPPTPSAARWSAGHAVFVVVGDMIDKGPSSLEVIELVRALQTDALSSGGTVIATLGNHEAEFFADPENSKADASDGIDPELRAHGIDVMSLANGADPRGAWMRTLPFGARVGRWFFSHAGNTAGRSIEALDRAIRDEVTARDYNATEAIGDGSILEARDWWTVSSSVVSSNARAMGVEHFVFGHTPSALGSRGEIATAASGALLRIDCGMSPDVDDSRGALLRVRIADGREVAEELTYNGSVRTVWRAP